MRHLKIDNNNFGSCAAGFQMKAAILICCVMFACPACDIQRRNADPRTHLLETLAASVTSGKVMFGHQDDLMYGHTWKIYPEDTCFVRSDVFELCGHYPAVLGLDLGEVELGGDRNIDGNLFYQMRGAAIRHHLRGGVVTISWHPRNPLTGGNAWDISSGETVRSILSGGPLHERFIEGWLRPVADFISSLTTEDGTPVPVIFRPWHEHTGSWFWWGEDLCAVDEYRALWRMTYDYMEERGLGDRLVWAYSPSTAGELSRKHFMERYPGDDIIDILGVDAYYNQINYEKDVRTCMECLDEICLEKGKIMALTETGWEGIPSDRWWCGILLPVLKEYPLCYVLTWRNACDKPDHFFGPWPGAQCSEDFINFINDDTVSSVEM